MKNIKFSPPDISDFEINEVIDTLKSGWITTGPKVKKFEEKISNFCNTNRTVCLNSQTACSEMILRYLGIGQDDEVITSSYTYTASASVVCHIGAKLKLIDIQKDSLEMDYDLLEKSITNETKVIIPVDIAGIPCDYDRIFDIVESKKKLFTPNNDIQARYGRIIILSDSAHSFGAKYKGKIAGELADFSSFSFHAVKNLTTGEGGALTWKNNDKNDDQHIYKSLQLLSLHGQSKSAFDKDKIGSWEYDIMGPYYKNNMTDIMASIGIAQLSRYNTMLQRRKNIIEKYNKSFSKHNIQFLEHYNSIHQSAGHLYITRVPSISHKDRCDIINFMAESGIVCNVHYKPLPLLSAYKNLGFDISNFKNSYDYYMNEITLPLHTLLKDDDVEYIIDKYIEILNKYAK